MRDAPVAYGRARIGWDALPEKLQRENRDLTMDDVLRIQHLLGQKQHESGRARAEVQAGVPVTAGPLQDRPRLVIGSGLDGSAAAVAAERTTSSDRPAAIPPAPMRWLSPASWKARASLPTERPLW